MDELGGRPYYPPLVTEKGIVVKPGKGLPSMARRGLRFQIGLDGRKRIRAVSKGYDTNLSLLCMIGEAT